MCSKKVCRRLPRKKRKTRRKKCDECAQKRINFSAKRRDKIVNFYKEEEEEEEEKKSFEKCRHKTNPSLRVCTTKKRINDKHDFVHISLPTHLYLYLSIYLSIYNARRFLHSSTPTLKACSWPSAFDPRGVWLRRSRRTRCPRSCSGRTRHLDRRR